MLLHKGDGICYRCRICSCSCRRGSRAVHCPQSTVVEEQSFNDGAKKDEPGGLEIQCRGCSKLSKGTGGTPSASDMQQSQKEDHAFPQGAANHSRVFGADFQNQGSTRPILSGLATKAQKGQRSAFRGCHSSRRRDIGPILVAQLSAQLQRRRGRGAARNLRRGCDAINGTDQHSL